MRRALAGLPVCASYCPRFPLLTLRLSKSVLTFRKNRRLSNCGRYTPAARCRKARRSAFATYVQTPDGFEARQGVTFIHASK